MAVATEMEDVNISAESFRIVLTSVSVHRDTVWIGTTAPACLKVWALSEDSEEDISNAK